MTWIFSKALCESLHCSQAQAAESLAGTCSGGEPFAQLNVMPTPHKFWRNDKMMEHSRLSQFGLTLQLLMETHGEELLTLYLAGFPVRTLAQPEKALESTAPGQAYGAKWHESFARYDHASSLWRTAQCSLLEGLDEFSETWPKWGLMRNGACSVRQTSALRISVTGSGLLPTPCASDYRGGRTPEAGEIAGRGPNNNFRDFCRQVIGWTYPNPVASEVLMGWPTGWTDLKQLEMAKYQLWRRQHSLSSQVTEDAA
jgi:hypothetical protein